MEGRKCDTVVKFRGVRCKGGFSCNLPECSNGLGMEGLRCDIVAKRPRHGGQNVPCCFQIQGAEAQWGNGGRGNGGLKVRSDGVRAGWLARAAAWN